MYVHVHGDKTAMASPLISFIVVIIKSCADAQSFTIVTFTRNRLSADAHKSCGALK